MRQPIFIAVGGTGQNVLASYLRLAQMSGFTPAPFYVLDSDLSGPQFQGLSDLQKSVRKVVGGRQPQRWKIHPYPTRSAGHKSFGELLRRGSDDARAVFDCLFSEEAEKTAIRDGMYGRPAIGAACMRLKLHQDDADLTELYQMLQGGEKTALLVGSCFGGTGSGGVPILARQLDRLRGQPGYDLEVRALVFLPWFRLELPPGEAEPSEKAVHERLNANFEPNAAASIRYFRTTLRDRIESLVFLGVPDPSRVARQSRESKQEEAVHPLNLLGALLAHELLDDRVATVPRGVSGYWYEGERGLDAQRLGMRVDGKVLSVADAVKRTALRERWLGILERLFKGFYGLPETSRPPLLAAALERVRGPRSHQEETAAEVCEHLRSEAARCRANLEWIERLEESEMLELAAESKRIQASEYQRLCDDPLPVVSELCRREGVVRQLEAADLESPSAFAERFTDLFLTDLGHRFDLH